MIEDKSKQGTAAWRAAHLGIPTASDFWQIMPTPKRGSIPASREDYKFKKVVERLIGKPWDVADGQQPILSQIFAIKRGKALEEEACRQFDIELKKRQVRGRLRRCGMFLNDERTIGASPDRMLVYNGHEVPCEVKSPLAHTHMEYLLSDISSPDNKYYAQIQGQILLTNAKKAFFYSYHPRCPGKFIIFERDQAYIDRLQLQLQLFCRELDEATERARGFGEFLPYREGEE